MRKEHLRLDITLVKRGLIESRVKAQKVIMARKVLVNGKVVVKPSKKVDKDAKIAVLEKPRYVSRGGFKLEKALKKFKIDVKDVVALDVGACTGGFTDCLLQHGAKKVYAVDVGKGQLSPKLRKDPRVKVFEDTDIRYLNTLPELMDLVVIDVAYISLRFVLPRITRFLKPNGKVIALIKPQFEVGPEEKKKGIVKDEKIRQKAIKELLEWTQTEGWKVLGFTTSPIKGKGGNIEYLVYLTRN